MGWTNKSTIDLIDLYKSQKVLWDSKHDEYYNKFSKNEAWDYIAKEMQMDAEECKRKMISLLASLRREKVKIRKCQLAGKKRFRSSWFAFDSLAWLLDRNNTDTTAPMLTTNLSGLIKDARGDEGELIAEESPNILKIIPCMSPKRRKTNENTSGTTENQTSDQLLQTEEECNFFGRFVTSKLRNYPVKTRSAVQHAISNILYNADQGKMESCRFNNNNFSLADELESLNVEHLSGTPNFYSVLLNATANGVKQEFLNNSESVSCHIE